MNDVPVHTIAGLMASMALRPGEYGDWPNVGTWLSRAAARLVAPDGDDGSLSGGSGLVGLLANAPVAAWARAAYLLRIGEQREAADEVLASAPSRASGPVYLGPRRKPSSWDAVTGVYDSVLAAR